MADCETVALIAGPQGPAGIDGTDGTNGVNAYTSTDADYTQPAVAADVTITVLSTAWMATGQVIYIANAGYYTVQSIGSTTSVTIRNLGYTGNAAAASIVASGQKVSPGGLSGSAGSLTGSAGGDLTGTYPNPTVDLLKITSAKMSVTGVTAGTYGSATNVPQVTVDVAGRVTAISNVAGTFSGNPTGSAGGDLTGTYPNPTVAANAVTTAKMSVTGVTAASYGSGTAIPVITVDVAGRITAASTTAVTFSGSYPTATYSIANWSGTQATTTSYVDLGTLTYTSGATAYYMVIANLTATSGSTGDAYLRLSDTVAGAITSSERSITVGGALGEAVTVFTIAQITNGATISAQVKKSFGSSSITIGSLAVIRLT